MSKKELDLSMMTQNREATTEVFWFDDNDGPISKTADKFVLIQLPLNLVEHVESQLVVDRDNNERGKVADSDDSVIEVLRFLKTNDSISESQESSIQQGVQHTHQEQHIYDDANNLKSSNRTLTSFTTTVPSRPFTTSISPNELLAAEVHKTSTSLVLGVLPQIPENYDASTYAEVQSNPLNHSALDCVYVGEKQGIVTLQVTPPYIEQLFRVYNLNVALKFLTVSYMLNANPLELPGVYFVRQPQDFEGSMLLSFYQPFQLPEIN